MGGALVVPLTVLLFAQWPLRDLISAYSRQTNDVAQMVFAVFSAVSIWAASLKRMHLAMASPSEGDYRSQGTWRPWVQIAFVGPWCLVVLWSAVPQAVDSVRALERFSEGLTQGYFVLRLAVVLLASLTLLHAVLECKGQLCKAPGSGA